MKKTVAVLFFLVMGFQSSFANELEISEEMRSVKSSPGGEILVYYKEGDTVVVRNCGTARPMVSKLSDCNGPKQENRVPLDAFKGAIRSAFSDGDYQDQVGYNLVKKFDASRGECGTDEILNGSPEKPGGGSDQSGKAAWLEKLLINSAAASVSGGLAARLQDCTRISKSQISYTNPSTHQTTIWRLIARRRDPHTAEFHEVWQDSRTLKLWGDTLDRKYSQYDAVELDLSGKKVIAEKACAPLNDPKQSDIAKSANARVDDKAWGVPTSKELTQADDDGITEVLPDMLHWYISASLNQADLSGAYGFYGGYGHIGVVNRQSPTYSVRCIGR